MLIIGGSGGHAPLKIRYRELDFGTFLVALAVECTCCCQTFSAGYCKVLIIIINACLTVVLE